MATITERKEYYNSNNELIDIIYRIVEDDGTIHKVGIGAENLLKPEAEQREVVKAVFNNSKTREVVTPVNESF
ncbi:MAG: hypothetical protein HYS25_00835 [Ignavibacteriales bacterium]|nr:hypothetical protein [Ignavibacteriales bacterium]